MPRIAPQHATDPWRPLCAWSDTCLVQWGGKGVVLSESGSYGTAFFEAFPSDGSGGYLRGEGKTVEEAEADCFSQWQRQHACHTTGGHRWTRARRLKPRGDGKDPRPRRGHVVRVNTYTNGGCFCLKCGAFATAMTEVVELGAWKAPLSASELETIADGGLRQEPWERRDPVRWAKYRRRLALRAKLHGLLLPNPNHPAHTLAPDADPFEDDAFRTACREAVVRFYAKEHLRLRDEANAQGLGITGLFDGLHLASFHRDAVSMGLLPAE
ncbi:hypothetical protein FW320_13025 [Azospirillum sp. Vi22]|uniref:hypothetical protein n=1 Tax=Azospirillum baldaniorum TaxID=1064539 RepID=UPI00157B80DE|nr:hypothetical protein [Azospirillum baldaniorum]NUB07094.1 hypothetical protein [Azospirillum baldaniorum]